METTTNWRERYATELTELEPILKDLGFVLDEDQPHLSGERFLMTKDKLVLSGRYKDKQVIIKAARKPSGKEEIKKESEIRNLLESIPFSSDAILFPQEVYQVEQGGYLIVATEHISQDRVFVSYPLEKQFFLILRAFEAQEAFHASTFEHIKKIEKVFETTHARTYSEEFDKFRKTITKETGDKELAETLAQASQFIIEHKRDIGLLCGRLTHTDFVPHNFRVQDRKIHTLDLSAIRFGNKYEGWARFMNYMIIHNPKLEKTLSDYVKENRTQSEFASLQAMRIFKSGLLLDYYARSLPKTEGDLKALTLERIDFWHEVLKFLLSGKDIPTDFVNTYKAKRDSLRSEAEKRRQREFAVA